MSNLDDAVVSFQPWKGIDYDSGIDGNKVMILGESHYHDCEDQRECREAQDDATRAIFHSELTRSVVRGWKDNPDRSPLSHQVPKLFELKKAEFWRSVVFYNYLQSFAGPKAKVRPKEEQWADDRNARAFQLVLDDCQPDRILVLGKKLWSNLPSSESVIAQRPKPEENLPVSNDVSHYDKVDRVCYWYLSREGKAALAMPIMHPSAPRYISEAWIEPVRRWRRFAARPQVALTDR